MNRRPSVLVADASAGAAQQLRLRVERIGCCVVRCVHSGDDVIATLQCSHPDFILIGRHLPGLGDEVSLSNMIRSRFGTQVIYVLAPVDYLRLEATSIIRRGECLVEPYSDGELSAKLRAGKPVGSLVPDPQVELEKRVGKVVEVHAKQPRESSTSSSRPELMHFARLTTMGHLAGGLVHELSQPITAILNYASTCVEHSKSLKRVPPVMRMALKEIVNEGQRASAIVVRVRSFLRKQHLQKAPIEVGKLVIEAIRMTEVQLRSQSIRPRIVLDGTLPPVSADEVLIEQVLINLILNALDAMKTNGRGHHKLIIRAHRATSCNKVEIDVVDNGSGVTSEQAEHIFEPFFSTKPNGLGIGLSMSRSILEAHSGCLTARANPDGGMCFTLSLPVVLGDSHDDLNPDSPCDR